MERSPLITHIAILVFKSNYKDKDGTTSKRLFFTLVYENDYLTHFPKGSHFSITINK